MDRGQSWLISLRRESSVGLPRTFTGIWRAYVTRATQIVHARLGIFDDFLAVRSRFQPRRLHSYRNTVECR